MVIVKSPCSVCFLLFLTFSGVCAQWNSHAELTKSTRIFIENLPKSSQVDALVVNSGSFDQTVFRYALDTKSQCLNPTDEIFDTW